MRMFKEMYKKGLKFEYTIIVVINGYNRECSRSPLQVGCGYGEFNYFDTHSQRRGSICFHAQIMVVPCGVILFRGGYEFTFSCMHVTD